MPREGAEALHADPTFEYPGDLGYGHFSSCLGDRAGGGRFSFLGLDFGGRLGGAILVYCSCREQYCSGEKKF